MVEVDEFSYEIIGGWLYIYREPTVDNIRGIRLNKIISIGMNRDLERSHIMIETFSSSEEGAWTYTIKNREAAQKFFGTIVDKLEYMDV